MENILEAKVQSFSYGEDLILKNLSLSVKKGELIILTGLSGCGKTTLLRLLNGLIPSFYTGDLNGEVKLLGKDISLYKKGELAKYIGNVFQNPKDQFFCDVVEDEIALVGENLGLERKILKEKVEEAMNLLEISYLRKKSVFELSGGERQKVAIARALSMEPKLLLADEISSMLDESGKLNIMRLLKQLQHNIGFSVLLVTHDITLAKKVADYIYYMDSGCIIEEGSVRKIFCKKGK